MERERLKNLASRKVQQEKSRKKPVSLCAKCGHESFLFDFRRPMTTKTCKNISRKAVEVVEVK